MPLFSNIIIYTHRPVIILELTYLIGDARYIAQIHRQTGYDMVMGWVGYTRYTPDMHDFIIYTEQ